MKGTRLYPLNRLREVSEELYQLQVAKYDERQHLLSTTISVLGNCLWNDVLFLTAVHPKTLKDVFESCGYYFDHGYRAFEIDVSQLDPARTTVMRETQIHGRAVYEAFDSAAIDQYAVIPQITIDYWRQQHRAVNPYPLLFAGIPHILYRGCLDTDRVIQV